MKKMNKISIVVATLITFTSLTSKAIYDENVVKKPQKSPRSAAECAPAQTVEYLNFNNVNALIETGGSMWQDRPNRTAAYEVPKNSGKTAIYSGSLWMGGTDVNQQLKIAAVTFRSGTNDFWTGPLTTDGSAEIDPDVCDEYDKFFHITRQQVVDYITWWNCNKNPNPAPGSQDGCGNIDFSDYVVPRIILDWPAHGDDSRGQDPFLAPFFDYNSDGLYNPDDGDYPYYDLNGDIDCRAVRDIRLFGDDTWWWVFNDKGNIHTETNGQSIGMEIRAQAFAFATNDEVNDMTFYNYELINRSTFTLFNTFFGQWVDADVGNSVDDYVGCDVERGLGYAYNGDQFDEDANGIKGYADLPAAIGVDFFEGPYQDNDGINNLVGIGPNEALNGIGYLDLNAPPELQDSIVDNERYGMRRFVYYDRGTNALRGDAVTALHHYNYLKSIWKDGAKMVYGGNGHPTDPNSTNIEADFMFPGDSDPLNWGTKGIDPGVLWTEVTAGNPPFDRRFIQSAGPFTLTPGAVNDITVGVVWAQASSGNNEASVAKMIQSDRKAQALFDNCFDVLDGPDAPDLSGVELNQEIILMISNRQGVSNNFKKVPGDYEEEDPFIITPVGESPYDNKYRFQGYLIYQVYDNTVSVSDLDNLDKARLAFQCDIKDSVADLINYEFDEELNASVPNYMVRDAANEGIVSSFRVTNDLFSENDPRLVNFKTYYFIAIAYAYNEYKKYVQDDPLQSDGQKLPFLSSRKSTSGAISSVAFTPHPQQPKYGGMKLRSSYGSSPEITRLEGQGNGGNALAFTPETLEDLLTNSFNPTANQPTYQAGAGPIDVKVVDPTSVVDGEFTLQVFENPTEPGEFEWKLWRVGGTEIDFDDTVYSQGPISIQNEQIIQDWGISVTVNDQLDPNGEICNSPDPDPNYDNGFITSYITYEDSSKAWLSGIQDVTGTLNDNWIRSGTTFNEVNATPDPTHPEYWDSYSVTCSSTEEFADPFGLYSSIINGTWGPYVLCAMTRQADQAFVRHAPAHGFSGVNDVTWSGLENLQSVDIVITDNQDLWTRCPVIETQDEQALAIGGARKGTLRQSPSVDKNGNDDGSGTMGMGWFPGYAVNLETGERLNMAFGEDSWLGAENGADMMWNPTTTIESGLDPSTPSGRQVKWGGKHYVYVFGNSAHYSNYQGLAMPVYDEGQVLKTYLENPDGLQLSFGFASCMWVGIPTVAPGRLLMETDVTVSIRVTKPYDTYISDLNQNPGTTPGLPMYQWNMNSLKTDKNVNSIAENALDMIRVVPNPYYAFAEHYEQSQLDNFVKITNLPERCTVSIYNVSGTLVRKYNKSDPLTEIKWDLVNQSNVPIAGGVYLIHVDAPGIGETIVKWFGVLRPIDLRGF